MCTRKLEFLVAATPMVQTNTQQLVINMLAWGSLKLTTIITPILFVVVRVLGFKKFVALLQQINL